MNRPSLKIRQWCPECQQATESIACDLCGGQAVTCAVCGKHPGCIGPEEDAEYTDDDYEDDDDE